MQTRTVFTLPEPVDQAFADLYGYGADDECCEAFASRWGGLELEQMQHAFEQGQGDDKVLAILAIGATATKEAEALLLAVLEHQETPRMQRWACAICLSRMKCAFPLIEPLLLDALSLEEYLQASQEKDDTHRHELWWCSAWRTGILYYMKDWQSPTFISTMRQIFQRSWEIQRTLRLPFTGSECYDQLALMLGQREVFDVLEGLDLPPAHQKVAMVFLVLGYLHVLPGEEETLLSLVKKLRSDRPLQHEVSTLLGRWFGLTQQEQQDCIRNFYKNIYARSEYRRPSREETEREEEGEIEQEEDRVTEKEEPIPLEKTSNYRGHTARIHALSWSPESTRLVSGSEDTTAQVWDAATGETIVTFDTHEASVNAVAWSPQGDFIASGGNDNTVYVWHAQTGEIVSTYTGHRSWIRSLAWSPDGTRLASTSVDKTVQIWDAFSGSVLLILRGHEGIVNSVTWSPDGRHLASGGGYPQCMIYLWDAHTGTQVSSYRGHTADTEKKRILPPSIYPLDEFDEELLRRASSVRYLQWSPGGSLLASAGPHSVCCVWNATTGEDTFITNRTEGPLVWSSDGETLLFVPTNTNLLEQWNVQTPTLLISYQLGSIGRLVQTSPDGKYLATAFDYEGGSYMTESSIWSLR